MSLLSLDIQPARAPEPEPEPDPHAPPLEFDLLTEGTPARPAPLGVSALVHLAVLLAIFHWGWTRLPSAKSMTDASVAREKVFLPPLKVLRTLVKLPPPLPAVPRREVPREKEKDRISVGAPVPVRQREPLELHRDDDLTKVAHGRTDGGAKMAQVQSSPVPEPERARAPLRGVGTAPILASLRELESRPLASSSASDDPLGLPSGTGQQMGPLFFDPQGADFTAWLNHFKNQVYRNWIVPEAARLGMRGRVGIAFTVERDGTVSAIDLLSSSGTAAFDRSAQNALAGSRMLPLPADFHPPRVTMQIAFIYG